MGLKEHISNLIEKLLHMSEATQRKCKVLEDTTEENQVVACENIFTLCTKIRQDCESFNEELCQVASNYNVELSCSRKVNSEDQSDKMKNHLHIESILADAVQNCELKKVSEEQLRKFQQELKNFTQNYWKYLENAFREKDIEDNLTQQLNEIFGSDSDVDGTCEHEVEKMKSFEDQSNNPVPSHGELHTKGNSSIQSKSDDPIKTNTEETPKHVENSLSVTANDTGMLRSIEQSLEDEVLVPVNASANLQKSNIPSIEGILGDVVDSTEDNEESIVSEGVDASLKYPVSGISDSQETQVYEIDSQSTQLDPVSETICMNEHEGSLEQCDFLSGLGLAKSDYYGKTNDAGNELVDVMFEEAFEGDSSGELNTSGTSDGDSSFEDSEPVAYTDKDAAEALKYIEDIESENESVKSLCNSDSLFLSEIDEESLSEIVEESSFQSQVVEKGAGREEPSQNISEIEVAIDRNLPVLEDVDTATVFENTQENDFVPKKCHVIVNRMNLEKYKSTLSSNSAFESDIENNLEDNRSLDENSANMDIDKANFVPRNCYVRLEPLRHASPTSELDTSSTDTEAEINHLCDISSLSKQTARQNKKESDEDKSKSLKRFKRRRKHFKVSGSETSDLSGFDSVSEEEMKKIRERLCDDHSDAEQQVPTALDPNMLLADIVCHTIHSSDSDSSSCSEDESKYFKKKKSEKKKYVSKESKQESWKDDPLLRGNLNISSREGNEKHKKRKVHTSDNDSDNVSIQPKKIKKVDSDWRSTFLMSDSSSDSSSEETEVNSALLKKENTNSDVEFIDITSPTKSETDINKDSTNQKSGRRNILSVLSRNSLTQETQQAAKEEEERLMKLQKRNQMRTPISPENAKDSIILDIAEDGYKVAIDPALSKRLFIHQVEGVKFMWDTCYLSIDSLINFEGTGCILAHNMGLGKTFQVVTLIHTLFSHSRTKTKHVLVVCPLSTVAGWKKEFVSGLSIARKDIFIHLFNIESSDSIPTKHFKVKTWKQRGGVLIVGYEAFEKLTRSNTSQSKILREALVNPGPDLVVCDEGHLLKNGKALRTIALMEIRTKRRIALTGTPLQNNLTEYYHMVQFVKPNLLGTQHEFSRQFVNPIMNGQYEDSVEEDIKLMKKRTHVLHRILKNTVQRYEATELEKYLLNMKDYALFIQLHPLQAQLYRTFIQLSSSRIHPKTKKRMRMFFNDYQIAKYICSHPQLLYTMEAQKGNQKKIIETDVISQEPEVHEFDGIPNGWWKSSCPEEVKTSIEFGNKLIVMLGIIEEAEKLEEKVLIFTSSLVELNSVEYFLKLKGTSSCPAWRPKRDYFRMDGTVPPSIRTRMCDMFNNKNNKMLRVFLMSHKVGGLGLNLVAANRVILLGTNFNPSLDSQSIYRAYRFGQDKPVCIYRLLCMGTMEEKIYHRCVTKLAIASRVVDKHQIARHYKSLNLSDLYTVSIDLSAERPTPAKPDDDLLASILLRFDCIHKYHHHQKLLENRPDEDLDEEDKLKAWEEFVQITENQNKNMVPIAKTPQVITNSEIPQQVITNSEVSKLTQMRWEQINQPGPSNMVPVENSVLPKPSNNIQLEQLDYIARFARNIVDKSSSSNQILKNTLMNNTVKDASVRNSSEILRNVSENTLSASAEKITKGPSQIIGPNPFVVGKMKSKKENLITKSKKTNIQLRTTSSDDFQKLKPGKSKIRPAKSTDTEKVLSPSEHNLTTKVLTHMKKAFSHNGIWNNISSSHGIRRKSKIQNERPVVIDDDEDVILIENSKEKSESSKDRSMGKNDASVLNETLSKLNKNGITLTRSTREQTTNKDEAFVIEII